MDVTTKWTNSATAAPSASRWKKTWRKRTKRKKKPGAPNPTEAAWTQHRLPLLPLRDQPLRAEEAVPASPPPRRKLPRRRRRKLPRKPPGGLLRRRQPRNPPRKRRHAGRRGKRRKKPRRADAGGKSRLLALFFRLPSSFSGQRTRVDLEKKNRGACAAVLFGKIARESL